MLRGWMRCYLTTSATDTPMRTEMSEASKAMPIQIAAVSQVMPVAPS